MAGFDLLAIRESAFSFKSYKKMTSDFSINLTTQSCLFVCALLLKKKRKEHFLHKNKSIQSIKQMVEKTTWHINCVSNMINCFLFPPHFGSMMCVNANCI